MSSQSELNYFFIHSLRGLEPGWSFCKRSTCRILRSISQWGKNHPSFLTERWIQPNFSNVAMMQTNAANSLSSDGDRSRFMAVISVRIVIWDIYFGCPVTSAVKRELINDKWTAWLTFSITKKDSLLDRVRQRWQCTVIHVHIWSLGHRTKITRFIQNFIIFFLRMITPCIPWPRFIPTTKFLNFEPRNSQNLFPLNFASSVHFLVKYFQYWTSKTQKLSW